MIDKDLTIDEINNLLNNGDNITNISTFAENHNNLVKDTLANITKENIVKLVSNDLKTWIDRNFTYMYDFSQVVINNGSNEIKKFIASYNFKSRMIRKFAAAARIKSSKGMVAFLIKPFNSKITTEVMELQAQPEFVNDELVKVYITKNEIQRINEIDNKVIFEVSLQGKDVVIKEFLLPVDSKSLNQKLATGKESTIKNIGYLPVVVDYANENGISEWENAQTLINFYATFEHKLQVEFEYVKTQLKLNPQWADKKAKQIQDDIEGGNTRIHEDYNDDMENSLTYLSNGGITTDIARSIRDDYKSQIREQLFMIGSNDSGTHNKHTTEAANENIYAYSYAWFKKNIFSETLSQLYFMIIDLSNKVGKTKIALPEYIECVAQLSRPLELVLNLNSESKENNEVVSKQIRVNENEGE